MNERILILGGRTGLGRAIADIHLSSGDDVTVVGRHAPAFEGTQPDWIQVNFLNDLQVDALESDLPGWELDRVYACTGRFLKRPVERVSPRDIVEVMRVNFEVPARLIRAALTPMLRTGKGHMIVVGSTTGDDAKANEAVYGASKAALMNFTRAIGRQQLPDGVRMTLFVPGGMKSELFYDGYDEVDQRQFMDPSKVAPVLLDFIATQTTPFGELKLIRAENEKLW